jgi:HlyD family secretion protein
MTANSPGSAVAAAIPPPPSRRLVRFGLPLLVMSAMGGLLAFSAGESLRPVPRIAVHPVLFDPARPDATPLPASFAPTPPSGDRAGGGGGGRFAGAGSAASGGTVLAPGWLEADPFFVASTALADGVVEQMLVLEGERVEAGQVVARLVDADARIDVAERESDLALRLAERDIAQADLAAARTDWAEPVERDRAVASAEAMLARTEAELQQLPMLVAGEAAERDRLADEAARAREAHAAGAVTDLELLIAEKKLEARTAALEALRQREAILEATAAAERAELHAARRHRELRVAERRALDAAVARAALAEAALEQARARLDRARLALDRMSVRAPVSGIVQRRLKVPGDVVMQSMDSPHASHIVHLYDPERMQVRVDVPLADASGLFAGQACEVVVEVLPGRTFRGELTRVTHEADLQKNTLQVKVRVLDPSPLLRPEMLTRVKFLPGPAAGPEPSSGGASAADDAPAASTALRVARAAVDRDAADGPRVWVLTERRGNRGTLRLRPVELLGPADGDADLVLLAGDLRPGDLLADAAVATAAGITLREGIRVAMHDPAAPATPESRP